MHLMNYPQAAGTRPVRRVCTLLTIPPPTGHCQSLQDSVGRGYRDLPCSDSNRRTLHCKSLISLGLCLVQTVRTLACTYSYGIAFRTPPGLSRESVKLRFLPAMEHRA